MSSSVHEVFKVDSRVRLSIYWSKKVPGLHDSNSFLTVPFQLQSEVFTLFSEWNPWLFKTNQVPTAHDGTFHCLSKTQAAVFLVVSVKEHKFFLFSMIDQVLLNEIPLHVIGTSNPKCNLLAHFGSWALNRNLMFWVVYIPVISAMSWLPSNLQMALTRLILFSQRLLKYKRHPKCT